jgi:hypothetical protein
MVSSERQQTFLDQVRDLAVQGAAWLAHQLQEVGESWRVWRGRNSLQHIDSLAQGSGPAFVALPRHSSSCAELILDKDRKLKD